MRLDIVKLVANGQFRESLLLYSKLHASSTSFNLYTFPCILKACAKLNYPFQPHIVHTHIIKSGFQSYVYAATALIHSYMISREFEYAHKVFDEMSQRNVASVSAMVSGLCENGCFEDAVVVFRDVGLRMFRPNSVLIASVLGACEGVDHGSQVHCWGKKVGVEGDVFVGTGLVSMYMGCGEPESATKVFEAMDNKNVVSYNAFLSGLVQNGVNHVVLRFFKRMLSDEKMPNFVTLVSVLGACSNVLTLQYGREVHGTAVKVGLENDTMVGTALVDMYAKCGSCAAYYVFKEMSRNRNLNTWNSIMAGVFLSGDCDTALKLFSELELEGLVPDAVTWNTMISGLSRQGKCPEAFQFFAKMISEGMAPSLKSLTSLLVACSITSCIEKGKQIHAHAIRAALSHDEFFATSLIDLYMKCGQSTQARKIFDHFRVKPIDPPIWNAMILGYGRNGEDESAFEIFNLMRKENVQLNSTTFSSMLSVCSHTGQVDKGLQLFEMMIKDYGLTPTQQHFACIINLLGRSGHLKKAQELVLEIRQSPASMFSSLLGAAETHFDTKLGEKMAKELAELDPENSAPFVVLSNIYAASGRWKDVERIRNMMVVKGVEKSPAYSVPMT